MCLFIIVLIFRLKNRILHEKSYPKQSPKVNLVKFIFSDFFWGGGPKYRVLSMPSRVGAQNIGSFRRRQMFGRANYLQGQLLGSFTRCPTPCSLYSQFPRIGSVPGARLCAAPGTMPHIVYSNQYDIV